MVCQGTFNKCRGKGRTFYFFYQIMLTFLYRSSSLLHILHCLVACLRPSVSSTTVGQHLKSRCPRHNVHWLPDCHLGVCIQWTEHWLEDNGLCFVFFPPKKGLRMDLREALITKWSRRVPWSQAGRTIQIADMFLYQDFNQEVWLLFFFPPRSLV